MRTVKTLNYTFPACYNPVRRAHVGVVVSGDLEILLEPIDTQSTVLANMHLLSRAQELSQYSAQIDDCNSDNNLPTELFAQVHIRTNVTGFDTVWQVVLERFFLRTPLAGIWELNDCGATPGVVSLRLQQAAHLAQDLQEQENDSYGR